MSSRPALPREIPAFTRTTTDAFADDPIWGPALRRSDGSSPDLEPYWRLFVDGAMRFGTVRTIDDGAAVSVWLPPGGAELDHAGIEALDHYLEREYDAPAREALLELYARFETSRALRPEHYYLSLLATHRDHRGRGVGQALLAEDLALWDAAGVPAYLESTNAGNDHRYARAGFREAGGFRAVRDDAWVSAMWRSAGGDAG